MRWVSGLGDVGWREVLAAEPMAQTAAPTAQTMLKPEHKAVPTAQGRPETGGERKAALEST
jgi:hypothetical protein